jgi:hypothetical protein
MGRNEMPILLINEKQLFIAVCLSVSYTRIVTQWPLVGEYFFAGVQVMAPA